MKSLLANFFLFASHLSADEPFLEKIHSDWGQWYTVNKVLYHEKTPLFEQFIFENENLGIVHVMDGVIQSTQKDEYTYQEMISHVPLMTHENPQSVLIIGGGDGGCLREVLKHDSVKNVTLCEIDGEAINFSKQHLTHLCKNAFDHPKATIVINDGAVFVKETQQKFDVIIIDGSDPVGPCMAIFTEEFFNDCKKCLNPKGIVVNMSGVPFFQPDYAKLTHKNMSKSFSNVTFFTAAVPTYVGGLMALGFATDHDTSKTNLETLNARFAKIKDELHYYNPQVHLASFALPNYIQKIIK